MITAEMLAEVLSNVTETVTACLPTAMKIFGTMLAIGFIPKVIKKLAK